MKKIVFLMALLSSLAFANYDFRSVLEESCNNGNSTFCLMLGTLYIYGQSAVRQDFNKAEKFLRKACNLGDATSCTVLGSLLENK